MAVDFTLEVLPLQAITGR